MIELALLVVFVIEGLIICVLLKQVEENVEDVERAVMAVEKFLRDALAIEGESEND